MRLGILGFGFGLLIALQVGCGDDEASGSSSGNGGGGASHTGGPGGSGGSPPACEPGSTRSCYDGPDATEDVGICKGGKQTCKADGSGYGACEGQVVPQPENCAQPEDEDCDGAAPACTGDVAWSEVFTGVGADFGEATCVDAAGYVYVVGEFSTALTFPDGTTVSEVAGANYSTIVAKLAGDGSLLWAKKFDAVSGGTNYPLGCAALPDSGGVAVTGDYKVGIDFGAGVVTGTAEHEPYVAALDEDGELLWATTFVTTENGYTYPIAVAEDGSIITGGGFRGTMTLDDGTVFTSSAAGDDGFLMKLDKSGKPVWTKHLTGPIDGGRGVYGIAISPSGVIGVTGGTFGPADFGSGPASTTAGADDDAFVAMFDQDGAQLSLTQFGDSSDQIGAGIGFDAAGNAFVAGQFMGQLDFDDGSLVSATANDIFVLKMDPAGEVIGHRQFGDSAAQEYSSGIAVDAAGNVVLDGTYYVEFDVGSSTVPATGGSGGYVIKLDSELDPLWATGFASPSATTASNVGIATDASSNVYVTGFFDVELQFDFTHKGTAVDGIDMFLVKLAP